MIRVIIERRVAEEMEIPYQKLMREIRQCALHLPGYISGETLRDSSNPHHYVTISTWRTRGEWDAWAVSHERQSATDQIAPMLIEPERLIILEPI